jgi:hypothetical protein
LNNEIIVIDDDDITISNVIENNELSETPINTLYIIFCSKTDVSNEKILQTVEKIDWEKNSCWADPGVIIVYDIKNMFKIEFKNEITSFEEKLINIFNDIENNISNNTSELIVDFFEIAKKLKILVRGEKLGDYGCAQDFINLLFSDLCKNFQSLFNLKFEYKDKIIYTIFRLFTINYIKPNDENFCYYIYRKLLIKDKDENENIKIYLPEFLIIEGDKTTNLKELIEENEFLILNQIYEIFYIISHNGTNHFTLYKKYFNVFLLYDTYSKKFGVEKNNVDGNFAIIVLKIKKNQIETNREFKLNNRNYKLNNNQLIIEDYNKQKKINNNNEEENKNEIIIEKTIKENKNNQNNLFKDIKFYIEANPNIEKDLIEKEEIKKIILNYNGIIIRNISYRTDYIIQISNYRKTDNCAIRIKKDFIKDSIKSKKLLPIEDYKY